MCPLIGARAFAKWGIDFVGPIDPPAYRTQYQYIIATTNYLTKWVGAKAKRHNTIWTKTNFLYQEVFTRYGLLIEIGRDRGTHFLNDVSEHLLDKFLVTHIKSTPYHLEAKGQVESTNETLYSIVTKLVQLSRKLQIQFARWAYRVA